MAEFKSIDKLEELINKSIKLFVKRAKLSVFEPLSAYLNYCYL